MVVNHISETRVVKWQLPEKRSSNSQKNPPGKASLKRLCDDSHVSLETSNKGDCSIVML